MSIKLEGRMKRPEYVAAMVRAYRMAIDGAPENVLEQALLDMQRIFSRGCSTGYYYGADVPAGARGTLSGEDAQILNGIYPTGSYEGDIYIDGKKIAFANSHQARAHGVGFVPQEINILPNRTVAENI